MADANEPRPDDAPNLGDLSEHQPPEVEAPRRAASAQFVVEREVGSQALLREAMDPANQSLRDALRLSYRVLQGVILVLVVLFVFSGFHRIEDGTSGVMLRWGRILPVGDNGALDVGVHFSKWPYPAGEFVTFRDRNRAIEIEDVFVPRLRGNRTRQDAINEATVNQHLTPGRDGSLLTAHGDIVHMKLGAFYRIEDPVGFVSAVENEVENPGELDADRLVQLALERAAVHVTARQTLDELVEYSEDTQNSITQTAQGLLDRVASGIVLTNLDAPFEPSPAFAIRKAYDELQQTRIQVGQRIDSARRVAERSLIEVAGESYLALVGLIEDYELALERGDPDGAASVLHEINARLESAKTSGEVARALSFARAYRATIETSLGVDAQYFRSLLPAYRSNPELVVARLWSETLRSVYSRPDVEKIHVPDSIGRVELLLAGSDRVRQIRRDNSVQRRERAALIEGIDLENPWLKRGRDIQLEGPGRRLSRQGAGLGQNNEQQ